MAAPQRLALALLLAVAAVDAVSPLSKVIELLQGLKMKIAHEGEEAEKLHKEAAAMYKEYQQQGAFDVQTAKSKIEDVSATIEKADSCLATAASKTNDLAGDIGSNEKDLKAATALREKEDATFKANEKELVESINTLERAINILQRNYKGSALLQQKVDKTNVAELIRSISSVIDATQLSMHDRKTLLGFVQSSEADADDDDEMGAPAAEAYKSHSKNILDVLEDLKQKAVVTLQSLRKQDMDDRHAFELDAQSLNDQIKVDNKELADNKARNEECGKTKATATGELARAKSDLQSAEEAIEYYETQWPTAQEQHAEFMKTNTEELKAIGEALAALYDNTGGAGDVVYKEADGAASFLQHKQARTGQPNFEVVNLVRKLAREQNDVALTQLAGQMSSIIQASSTSGADPFKKVREMISGMIERLVSQGTEEANHKAYCDEQMGETKTKMDELKYDIDKYKSKLDKQESAALTLKAEIQALNADLAAAAKEQAERDELRKQAHANYVSVKSDLELGSKGVRQAASILREALGGSDHTKTILGLLEVIGSDFARNLAEVESDEEAQAVDYEKFSQENRVATAMKKQDVAFKTKEATATEQDNNEIRSDLDSVMSELDTLVKYNENILAQCTTKPETYDERKGRREAEISGLKEALKILEGSAAFLQTQQSRRLALRGGVLAP